MASARMSPIDSMQSCVICGLADSLLEVVLDRRNDIRCEQADDSKHMYNTATHHTHHRFQ